LKQGSLFRDQANAQAGGWAGPRFADGENWSRGRCSGLRGWPFPPPWAVEVIELYPLTEQEGIAFLAITIS